MSAQSKDYGTTQLTTALVPNEDTATAATNYDLFKLLKRLTADIGFHHFIVLDLDRIDRKSLEAMTVLTNWPAELVRAHDGMRLFEDCPVLALLASTNIPVSYDIHALYEAERPKRNQRGRRLFDEFGHRNGLIINVFGHRNRHGAIGFAGDRPPLSAEDEAVLGLLAARIWNRLVELEKHEPKAPCRVLTGRERDCVLWTAAGKTSAEVASILGISANTVNHYLAAAATKLGTVNKAHTVATAIRRDLLVED